MEEPNERRTPSLVRASSMRNAITTSPDIAGGHRRARRLSFSGFTAASRILSPNFGAECGSWEENSDFEVFGGTDLWFGSAERDDEYGMHGEVPETGHFSANPRQRRSSFQQRVFDYCWQWVHWLTFSRVNHLCHALVGLLAVVMMVLGEIAAGAIAFATVLVGTLLSRRFVETQEDPKASPESLSTWEFHASNRPDVARQTTSPKMMGVFFLQMFLTAVVCAWEIVGLALLNSWSNADVIAAFNSSKVRRQSWLIFVVTGLCLAWVTWSALAFVSAFLYCKSRIDYEEGRCHSTGQRQRILSPEQVVGMGSNFEPVVIHEVFPGLMRTPEQISQVYPALGAFANHHPARGPGQRFAAHEVLNGVDSLSREASKHSSQPLPATPTSQHSTGAIRHHAPLSGASLIGLNSAIKPPARDRNTFGSSFTKFNKMSNGDDQGGGLSSTSTTTSASALRGSSPFIQASASPPDFLAGSPITGPVAKGHRRMAKMPPSSSPPAMCQLLTSDGLRAHARKSMGGPYPLKNVQTSHLAEHRAVDAAYRMQHHQHLPYSPAGAGVGGAQPPNEERAPHRYTSRLVARQQKGRVSVPSGGGNSSLAFESDEGANSERTTDESESGSHPEDEERSELDINSPVRVGCTQHFGRQGSKSAHLKHAKVNTFASLVGALSPSRCGKVSSAPILCAEPGVGTGMHKWKASKFGLSVAPAGLQSHLSFSRAAQREL